MSSLGARLTSLPCGPEAVVVGGFGLGHGMAFPFVLAETAPSTSCSPSSPGDPACAHSPSCAACTRC